MEKLMQTTDYSESDKEPDKLARAGISQEPETENNRDLASSVAGS